MAGTPSGSQHGQQKSPEKCLSYTYEEPWEVFMGWGECLNQMCSLKGGPSCCVEIRLEEAQPEGGVSAGIFPGVQARDDGGLA